MKLASPKAWDTEEGPPRPEGVVPLPRSERGDRKSTRLNSSHGYISYAVFCLKKKQFFDQAGRDRHHARCRGARSLLYPCLTFACESASTTSQTGLAARLHFAQSFLAFANRT